MAGEFSTNSTGLTPEELTREAYKTLARDKARLGGTNYPVYRGATTAPMSGLTQRARELRGKFQAKPAPYSQKLERVLNRSNQGLTPENIQGLLSQLSMGQRQFGQNTTLNALKNQFLSSYNQREPEFSSGLESDISGFLPVTAGGLQDTNRAASTLEGSRNRQIAKTLQNLQADKQARREGLIGSLEQFGNQKHAHTNMVNAANRGQFQEEVNAPYRKMQMLEQAVGPYRANLGEETHPDLAPSQGADVAQALRAYNAPSSRYPGQLVANLPPEIQASGAILERLKPSFRDNYTDKRKSLTRELVGNENLSAKALQNLSPAMAGQISQLETEGSRRMNKDLAALNNRYIKLGQYGSAQHIGAAEQRARELNQGMLEQRNNILQNALKQQLQLQHGNEISNIRQLGQIGQQSHQDYGNLLKNLRDTNKLGTTKFGNDQAENEELYKNFQNENLWLWPHMRGAARNGARGSSGNPAQGILGTNPNISLENLANLNTAYSELNREPRQNAPLINSAAQARDELQAEQAVATQKATMLANQQAQAAKIAAGKAEREMKATEKSKLQKLIQEERGFSRLPIEYPQPIGRFLYTPEDVRRRGEANVNHYNKYMNIYNELAPLYQKVHGIPFGAVPGAIKVLNRNN